MTCRPTPCVARSRRKRLPPAALLVLALSGCFPLVDVAPPERCEQVAGAALPSIPDVVVAGESASVTLTVSASNCLPVETSAYVEVDGPDLRRLPATLKLETVGRVARVTVTFTPALVGPHQVAVFVEPQVGASRKTVEVRRVAPLSVAARVEAPCAQEAQTASGAWICLAGARVTVWRDGMQLQALPATGFAISGDVLWLLAPGQVERFEDHGGSYLTRVPDAALAFAPMGQVMARGGDELWEASVAAVRRLRLGPGGLEEVGRVALPPGLCEGDWSARVASEDEAVWTACTSRRGAARLCRFEVPATEAGVCREVEGELVGFEAGGLWLEAGGLWLEAGGLHLVDLSGRALSVALPGGAKVVATTGGWPLVVSSEGRGLLPQVQASEVGLDAVPENVSVLSVSRDTVIAGSPVRRVAYRRDP
ncbi:MAG: hypothetical protein AB1938_04965 [Myxococcota bacterium]